MVSKTILVTGGNRGKLPTQGSDPASHKTPLTGSTGIGFAIIQSLAQKAPENTYLLGVRSLSSGANAIKELRDLGISSKLESIELDITKDEQVHAAAETIKQTYGRLDVLVNNAGVAQNPTDLSDFREVYNRVFDANITSVALVTNMFLPLLKASPDARVIIVSSARASVARVTGLENPPTASIPYSISKTALNVMAYEMAKLEDAILYQVVSPGHCKTAFNGFRGRKDPLDGARVVVELVCGKREEYPNGFWEFEDGGMRAVPW